MMEPGGSQSCWGAGTVEGPTSPLTRQKAHLGPQLLFSQDWEHQVFVRPSPPHNDTRRDPSSQPPHTQAASDANSPSTFP